MKIYKEYDIICKECFENDHNFRYYLNQAFENGLDIKKKISFRLKKEFCIASMLAQFTSYVIKKGVKEMERDEAGDVIDSIVVLVVCIEDKDKYLHFLTREMSKWLLDSDLTEGSSFEWDEYLIKSIKAKLGNEFSKNIEAMTKDVKLCYERSLEVKKYLKNSISEDFNFPDLHVNVLAKCEWLVPIKFDIKPSKDIETIQRVYKQYFLSRTKNVNKNLDWEYFYGRAEVRCHIDPKKKYTLICKPYQYFVLKFLESKNAESVSGADLQKGLEIKENEFENLAVILISMVFTSLI